MAHPIRDIGRMTTKSKQIDGMGFGGTAPDVNEVAGALAMAHPDTGIKLADNAYYLARILHAKDDSSKTRRIFRVGAISALRGTLECVNCVNALKLFNIAFQEIQSPIMRLNRKTGVQEIKPISKSEICRRLDIKGNKLPDKISIAYNQTLEQLYLWNAAAISHVRAAMREDEAA